MIEDSALQGSKHRGQLGVGSRWVRWEPHVHLPGTADNDQFDGTLDEALDLLASREPRIEVAGITDYYTTRLYRAARESWGRGHGSGITELFPNVELRLENQGAKSSINFHLLCKPQDVDELDRFLGQLSFSGANRRYFATYEDLVRLGRDNRGDASLDEKVALCEGVRNFKVNFDALRDLFMNDTWAKSHLVVAFAGGTNDGTSGAGSGTAGVRRKIEKFAHVIFSSNPGDALFWSGQAKGSPAQLFAEVGGPKPCLHGSDAHREAELGIPKLGRYTWIKGVADFESLRMAQRAPATRVVIGAEEPQVGAGNQRVTQIDVPGSAWFPAGPLPINPGLVAIIGSRGSGKTALADVIAAAAGSSVPHVNGRSFLARARPHLGPAEEAHLAWADGATSRAALGISPDLDAESISFDAVRYLSQQFVDDLCAADGVTQALLDEIERVVFDSWPAAERQGTTSFRELLELRLTASRSRQAYELGLIADLSEQREVLLQLRDNKPAIEKELVAVDGKRNQLGREIGSLVGSARPGDADRLKLMTDCLEAREVEVQAHERRATALLSLRELVSTYLKSEMPRLLATWRREHESAALSGDQWAELRLRFEGDPAALLDGLIAEGRAAAASIRGDAVFDAEADLPADASKDMLLTLTIEQLKREKERLEKLIGLDVRRQASLRKKNDALAKLNSQAQRLEAEIRAAAAAPPQIEELRAERLEHYASYFDALLEEKEQLNELYAPLHSVMSSLGSTVNKLEFAVRRVVDLSAWADEGENLLDLRKAGAFRGTGELLKASRTELESAWMAGDGASAAAAMDRFARGHTSSFNAQCPYDVSDPAYREWRREFSRWLYGAHHVTLRYSLQYEGTDVERLSPGTRGIVLLLLYLAVDQSETCPLIIDQPEENLDPESVYKELVSLFRDASTRRQIIMVTHNANLVVNSDVDQVIVARSARAEAQALPQVTYTAGGLEDPSIRTLVCEVLEGGREAFLERARRLGLDLPDHL